MSHLTPHTSHLTPHTSHLTPHTSHLTPHTPHPTHLTHLTSHTSPHTPHTPHLTHLTSHLTHLTSHLTHLTSHLTPHGEEGREDCACLSHALAVCAVCVATRLSVCQFKLKDVIIPDALLQADPRLRRRSQSGGAGGRGRASSGGGSGGGGGGATTTMLTPQESELENKLVGLRAQLAKRHNIPPYQVCARRWHRRARPLALSPTPQHSTPACAHPCTPTHQ